MKISLSVVAIVAALSVAALASRHVVLSRTEAKLPKHYVFTDVPRPEETMRIWLALPQRNIEFLLAELDEISNPLSPRYSSWYTVDEVQALTATEPGLKSAVLAWLHKHVPRRAIRVRSDSIDFVAPVSVIEAMFETTVKAFKHRITGRRALAAVGAWSIPSELADAIEMITGISDFPIPRSSAAYAAAEAAFEVTGSSPYDPPSSYSRNSALGQGFWPQFGRKVPQTLKSLYNISSTLSASGVTQAAVEFQGVDCYAWLDFQTFQADIGMTFVNITGVIGDPNFDPVNCQSESNLDIEQIMAFGVDASATFYFANQNWIYEFTQTYLSLPAAQSPMVASLSYGWMEAESCQIAPSVCTQLGVNSTGYVERSNAEMAKLGLAGKTLVICTQDEGAPSDNNAQLTNAANPVWPIYPASSPYGLAVGAHALLDAATPAQRANIDYSDVPICSKVHCSQGTVESVAMSPTAAFTSGGGFSGISSRPQWQDAVVEAYLSSTGLRPASTKFNAANRAYPDVSAVGEAIYYYAPGGSSGGSGSGSGSSSGSSFGVGAGSAVHFEGGTSASTPITAGIISLLVAHNLALTGKPLGFVTPLMYEIAALDPLAFNQPLAGGNNTCTGWGREMPCCQVAREGDDTLGRVCDYGYSVEPQLSWNPAVGLGSPNVGRIIDAMTKLNEIRKDAARRTK